MSDAFPTAAYPHRFPTTTSYSAYAVDNLSDGEIGPLPTLSELVERDLEEELKIIKDTGGRLWPKWLALGIVFRLSGFRMDFLVRDGVSADAWFAAGRCPYGHFLQ